MAAGGVTDVQDFQNSIEIDDYARFAVDEYSDQQVYNDVLNLIATILVYLLWRFNVLI